MAEGEENQKLAKPGDPIEPGTVISPGGEEKRPETAPITFDQEGPVEPGVVVSPEAGVAVQAPPEPPQPEAPAATPSANPEPQPASAGTIAWTASEYVAHDKSAGWYLTLFLAAAGLSVIVYLVTKDIISVVVVLVSAILIGAYGARQPRQLEYVVGPSGITIGQKQYAYQQFRYFAVVPEGAFSSIVFMPLSRFAMPLSIYYAPEDEEKIVKLLSDHLPYEQQHNDAIDNLMRRIRF